MMEYARMGAVARLSELRAEIADIERAFPGLGGPTQRAYRPRAAATQGDASVDAAATLRRRTRKPMTAAQRKAVGERMKKYWAARRKSAAK